MVSAVAVEYGPSDRNSTASQIDEGLLKGSVRIAEIWRFLFRCRQGQPARGSIRMTFSATTSGNLMVRSDEGLTKTYNRFHDLNESDPAVAELRDLHASMDRAVLDAYGWTDIPTDCEFLLDYEIDEEEWGTRKKPYRYRCPDDVRDEVLARLLELNAQRSEAEQRSGGTYRTTNPRTSSRRPRGRVVRSTPSTVPTPGTLWNDGPFDNTASGGGFDGAET